MIDACTDYGRAERFAALIVGDRVLRAQARDAVTMVDGRVLGETDWSDAEASLVSIGKVTLIVAEGEGVPPDRLAPWLALLALRADAAGAIIVLSLGTAQLDLAAPFLGGTTIVLCEPTLADRVVAIAAATAGRLAVTDRIREDEAARLARLNAEVARIAETLARLTQRDPPARNNVGDRHVTFDPGPLASEEPITAAELRRTIRARRTRDEMFGPGLFEDPAWDMMLDLYAAHLERAQVSVSSLCIAAAVAPTTALRWIGRMVDAGLFVRQPDPFDKRRIFMLLSRDALDRMRRYVRGLQEAGLTIA